MSGALSWGLSRAGAASAAGQEQGEGEELEGAEADFDGVRHDGGMVLGEEGFDHTGPDQEEGDAADERDQVWEDEAQAVAQGEAFAPTDEGAGQDEAGLAADEAGISMEP